MFTGDSQFFISVVIGVLWSIQTCGIGYVLIFYLLHECYIASRIKMFGISTTGVITGVSKHQTDSGEQHYVHYRFQLKPPYPAPCWTDRIKINESYYHQCKEGQMVKIIFDEVTRHSDFYYEGYRKSICSKCDAFCFCFIIPFPLTSIATAVYFSFGYDFISGISCIVFGLAVSIPICVYLCKRRSTFCFRFNFDADTSGTISEHSGAANSAFTPPPSSLMALSPTLPPGIEMEMERERERADERDHIVIGVDRSDDPKDGDRELEIRDGFRAIPSKPMNPMIPTKPMNSNQIKAMNPNTVKLTNVNVMDANHGPNGMKMKATSTTPTVHTSHPHPHPHSRAHTVPVSAVTVSSAKPVAVHLVETKGTKLQHETSINMNIPSFHDTETSENAQNVTSDEVTDDRFMISIDGHDHRMIDHGTSSEIVLNEEDLESYTKTATDTPTTRSNISKSPAVMTREREDEEIDLIGHVREHMKDIRDLTLRPKLRSHQLTPFHDSSNTFSNMTNNTVYTTRSRSRSDARSDGRDSGGRRAKSANYNYWNPSPRVRPQLELVSGSSYLPHPTSRNPRNAQNSRNRYTNTNTANLSSSRNMRIGSKSNQRVNSLNRVNNKIKVKRTDRERTRFADLGNSHHSRDSENEVPPSDPIINPIPTLDPYVQSDIDDASYRGDGSRRNKQIEIMDQNVYTFPHSMHPIKSSKTSKTANTANTSKTPKVKSMKSRRGIKRGFDAKYSQMIQLNDIQHPSNRKAVKSVNVQLPTLLSPKRGSPKRPTPRSPPTLQSRSSLPDVYRHGNRYRNNRNIMNPFARDRKRPQTGTPHRSPRTTKAKTPTSTSKRRNAVNTVNANSLNKTIDTKLRGNDHVLSLRGQPRRSAPNIRPKKRKKNVILRTTINVLNEDEADNVERMDSTDDGGDDDRGYDENDTGNNLKINLKGNRMRNKINVKNGKNKRRDYPLSTLQRTSMTTLTSDTPDISPYIVDDGDASWTADTADLYSGTSVRHNRSNLSMSSRSKSAIFFKETRRRIGKSPPQKRPNNIAILPVATQYLEVSPPVDEDAPTKGFNVKNGGRRNNQRMGRTEMEMQIETQEDSDDSMLKRASV